MVPSGRRLDSGGGSPMTTRLSLSWLNLFLVLGLVAAWQGIWNVTRKQVEREGRLSEPREDEVQLGHQVPRLQADITRTLSELASIQSKIHEQRLERASVQSALRTLLDAYPAIQSLGVGSSDARPEWLMVRPEVLQAFAQARLDVDTTSRLVVGLESDLDALITRRADLLTRSRPPEPSKTSATRDQWVEQARQEALGEQTEAYRKKLAEARVELVRRRTQVEAMAASDHRLGALPANAAGLLNLPAETVTAFAAWPTRRQTSAALDSALNATAEQLRAEIKRLSEKLIQSQREAGKELELERDNWDFQQRTRILVRAIGPAFLLFGLVVAAHIALMLFSRPLDVPSLLLLYGTAFGALIVLYAYQSFDAAAGAVAVLVLLLLGGGLLMRRGGGS
jgi:hypothetical protein